MDRQAVQRLRCKCAVLSESVANQLQFKSVLTPSGSRWFSSLHSAKGGTVETGCSGLHDIIGCYYIMLSPIHCTPPPTAPLCNEYPDSHRRTECTAREAESGMGRADAADIHVICVDMCVYMYVCIYIYIYMYIHCIIYIYIHIHIHIHIQLYICMYIHTYSAQTPQTTAGEDASEARARAANKHQESLHIRVCIYIYIYISVYLYVYIYICACMYIYIMIMITMHIYVYVWLGHIIL